MIEKLSGNTEATTTPEVTMEADLEKKLGESAIRLIGLEKLDESDVLSGISKLEEVITSSDIPEILKSVEESSPAVREGFFKAQLEESNMQNPTRKVLILPFLADYMSSDLRNDLPSRLVEAYGDVLGEDISLLGMMLMPMANYLPEKQRNDLVSRLLEQSADSDYSKATAAESALSLGLRHLSQSDHDKVLSLILEHGGYTDLFLDPRNLSETDKDKVFDYCVGHENYRAVFNFADKISDTQVQSAIKMAVDAGKSSEIFCNIHKISSEQTQIAVDLALEANDFSNLLFFADKFTAEQVQAIVDKVMERGKPDVLLRYPDKLSSEQIQSAIDKVISNKGSFPGSLFDKIHHLTYDQQKQIVTNLIGLKNYDSLFDNQREVEYILGSSLYQIDGVFEWLKDNKRYAYLIEVFMELTHKQQVATLDGMWHDESLAESLTALGISKVATAGIEQLKQYISSFKSNMFDNMELVADPIELQEKGSFAAMALGVASGFFGAEGAWGNRSLDNLIRKIEYRVGIEVEPMKSEYRPSEVYKISSISEKKQRELLNTGQFNWGEGIENRYADLRNDIVASSEMYGSPRAIVKKIRELKSEILSLRDRLNKEWNEALQANNLSADFTDINSLTDERTRFSLLNIDKQRKPLGYVSDKLLQARPSELLSQMESPQDINEYFTAIYANISPKNRGEKLDSLIRQMTFAWAMDRNPQTVESMRKLSETIDIDSVSQVREFIEHIVNQETFGQYFTDRQQSVAFKNLVGTKGLQEAMIRYSKAQSRDGSTEIQFIPTRSILADIAGQLGDACYADTEDSMVESHPNITAVIMRSRPNTASERIVGTSLFIETTNQATGQPILVVRALNPSETYITSKVAVDEFYKVMVDYAKKQASALGMEAGITIDNHSGGCGTNRPVLHGYMLGERSKLQPVKVDPSNSTFNGYDISRGKVFAL